MGRCVFFRVVSGTVRTVKIDFVSRQQQQSRGLTCLRILNVRRTPLPPVLLFRRTPLFFFFVFRLYVSIIRSMSNRRSSASDYDGISPVKLISRRDVRFELLIEINARPKYTHSMAKNRTTRVWFFCINKFFIGNFFPRRFSWKLKTPAAGRVPATKNSDVYARVYKHFTKPNCIIYF